MADRLFVRLEGDALHGPESNAPAGTLTAFEVRRSRWRRHLGGIGRSCPSGRGRVLLLRRLRTAAPARAAARAARIFAMSGGRRTVRDVAAEVGVGERRLQQLFHEHVGLSPRAWSRLARTHARLRSLRRVRSPAWAELALDHGFYDQAHLANEFRALCGMTPSECFRRTVSGSSKTAA